MKYQVWMEGYLCTGMEGVPEKASYIGEFEADSFQEACYKAAQEKGYLDLYDPVRLSVWGCRLFDNAAESRKNFG